MRYATPYNNPGLWAFQYTAHVIVFGSLFVLTAGALVIARKLNL